MPFPTKVTFTGTGVRTLSLGGDTIQPLQTGGGKVRSGEPSSVQCLGSVNLKTGNQLAQEKAIIWDQRAAIWAV